VAVTSASENSHPRGDGEIVTRRAFVSLAWCFAMAACAGVAPGRRGAAGRVGLEEFMRLSRALTAFPELADEASGHAYFAALTAEPEGTARLAELSHAAGLGGAHGAPSARELEGSEIYAVPQLAALADAIVRCWYTGVYDAPVGGPAVATYVDALAWRALGYRGDGPSTCSGEFGHWAEPPRAG
jgi:Membrane bound FAD containing D-sorbitol dehydrogenase